MRGPRSTRSPTKTAVRPSGWRARRRSSSATCVAELARAALELVAAAVDVADDVERAVLVAPVVPQPLASIVGRVDLLGRVRGRGRARNPRACSRCSERRSSRALVADDVRAEVAVGPLAVALVAEPLRQVEARSRPAGSGARGRARRAARGPRAARSSHRPPSAGRAASACAAMKWSSSNASSVARLVVLVVGDEPAAGVRREDLGRQEVLARERRLARAGRADQHDERELGDRRGRAWCSAALEHRHLRRRRRRSASSGPTGRKRDRVAVRPATAPRPSPRTRARVHSKRWSRWRNSPGGQRRRTARCTRRSAS